MKKVITLFLSFLLGMFALLGAGCSNYYQTSVGGDTSGAESSSGTETPETGDPYTVTLRTTDGGNLPVLDGVYAQWTEINGANVYRAPFNTDGVATSYKPDGEYQVTLSTTLTGYTYDPNIYFANNVANDKVIELYPLREYTGGDGNVPPDHCLIGATGAYRFIFDKPTREFYFAFGVAYSGEMSFQSLLSTTENEVCPIFYECFGTHLPTVRKSIKGGGSSNSYTKNFYHEVGLTNSQEMLFKLGVETVNANAFPVTIDVLIRKEGEYTLAGDNLTMVSAPEDLEDFSRKVVRGTFKLLADTNNKVLDDTMVVYVAEEDRFYVKGADGEADTTKMLYVMLKKDLPGILTTSEGTGLSYPEVRHTAYHSGKNYTQFIQAYFEKANRVGSYPATAALKEYLYDFSLARNLFYDNFGAAEVNGGYSSNKQSQWLFACGYYE